MKGISLLWERTWQTGHSGSAYQYCSVAASPNAQTQKLLQSDNCQSATAGNYFENVLCKSRILISVVIVFSLSG